MALLKVGIHENLVLLPKTKVNEHGTLELVIATVQDNASVMNAFVNNEVFQAQESNIRFYPPNVTAYDKTVKTAAEIGSDLMKMRHQFMCYGRIFAPKEKVEAAIGGTKMFEGLGVAPEDYAKAVGMLTQEAFLSKVATNLANKFVAFLGEVNAFSGEIKFRQKFLRQSDTKNYATVPTSDFDVWIEPMDVPKSASKIAYSEWEIKNKKNNPDPVASDAAKASKPQDTAKAAALFGDATPEAPKASQETPTSPAGNQPNLFVEGA